MAIVTNQRSRILISGAKWYRAGGAPAPVAAYQPIRAASLADSYRNLTGNTAYNAAPGTAPTFAAATGWGGGGNAYLTTGITPTTDYTLIVRFSDAATNDQYLGGSFKTSPATIFGIYPRASAADRRGYWNGTSAQLYGARVAAGVIAIAGNTAYFNGSADGTIPNPANTGLAMYLLALNQGGAPAVYFTGNVQAVAIYNAVLTAPQVLAISTAMAAL